MLRFWPQSVILLERPGLDRTQINRWHHMNQLSGWLCKGPLRFDEKNVKNREERWPQQAFFFCQTA